MREPKFARNYIKIHGCGSCRGFLPDGRYAFRHLTSIINVSERKARRPSGSLPPRHPHDRETGSDLVIHYTKLGQTLAEIVVVIGVVLLLVTGLVVGATGSLKAANYGRAKSVAVGYAQEALELVRSLRDAGWDTFASYADPAGKLWCLDQTDTWTLSSGGVCPVNLGTTYTRSVNFTWIDPQMKIEVVVSWTDGTKTYKVELSTYLTQWR